jgi:hypothetical protein
VQTRRPSQLAEAAGPLISGETPACNIGPESGFRSYRWLPAVEGSECPLSGAVSLAALFLLAFDPLVFPRDLPFVGLGLFVGRQRACWRSVSTREASEEFTQSLHTVTLLARRRSRDDRPGYRRSRSTAKTPGSRGDASCSTEATSKTSPAPVMSRSPG